MKYNPQDFEKKWQDKWFSSGLYEAKDFDEKPKKYVLVEFPYPSGDGVHMGHTRNWVMLDAYARFFRMNGYNVMYPMGWDAFGLPAENYAIKTKRNPKDIIKENTDIFRRQLKSLGISFDWSREIDTTDPEYYKWTQWIFLKLYEHGLAYQAEAKVNWCPKCKVVCANEEVIDGKHERCDSTVEFRDMLQWYLKITAYADKLADDLDLVDFPDSVVSAPRNWIGRSYGAEVIFKTENKEVDIKVFTTRPDTLFGCTYMVVSPEYSELDKLVTEEQKEEVDSYVEKASKKSELDRMSDEKEKTGVFTGSYAINPVNNEEIPIWIGDYVLASYGTGAIMAVPGHDQRDWDFAKKYGLSIVEVIKGGDVSKEAYEDVDSGVLVNSGFLDGLNVDDAIEKINQYLEKNNLGETKVNYHLRDWLFSRQRYWGEPFPIIHCDECGIVPVPEKELPVELPEVDDYAPTGTGESPLANIKDWVNVECPKCGKDARRETDTMPNWAGSSWYFLRYCDPNNNECFADQEKLNYWMPVDIYDGGSEHITLHLLYSRFWHKFLYDIGLVPTKEPYAKRRMHGVVLGEGGVKMSKSLGNVVTPDDMVNNYSADVARTYVMFMGPFENTCEWNDEAVQGVNRFLKRFFEMVIDRFESVQKEEDHDVEIGLNNLIKKLTNDIPELKFNTSVASFMEFVNNYKMYNFTLEQLKKILILLAPFAPHMAEELWGRIAQPYSVHQQEWPNYDEDMLIEDTLEIPVQVNGKVRGRINIPNNASNDDVKQLVLNDKVLSNYIDGEVKDFIYIPGKIINVVCG